MYCFANLFKRVGVQKLNGVKISLFAVSLLVTENCELYCPLPSPTTESYREAGYSLNVLGGGGSPSRKGYQLWPNCRGAVAVVSKK